jgi:gentisate 1,2-dioxygenase
MTQTGVKQQEQYDMIAEAEGYVSPYERWKAAEGLPTIRGMWVPNVYDVELTPWESRGGAGVFINLDGTGGFNDTYVCEIPPGGSLRPRRHIYDETIFILKGRGATSVWLEEGKEQLFEWQERSFFAIPPNAWYQHSNLSGAEPARFLAMTAAPRVIDTFKNMDFVFDNPFVFRDRFDGENDYFQERENPARGERRSLWTTNLVTDILESSAMAHLVGEGDGRGAGARSIVYCLVNSTVRSHSSSWPVGTYKKAHRHGPGIHVLILQGKGYSLMWDQSGNLHRIDWGPGSMLVPPEMWFHQHFNAGAEPVLFLAIGWGSDKPKAGGKQYVYKSAKEGGDQIEYEDEDPAVHGDFESALKEAGADCRMGGFHPLCTYK